MTQHHNDDDCKELARKRIIEAFDEYAQTGHCSIRCDQCGEIIKVTKPNETGYKSECPCGKYSTFLKGI